VLQVAVIVTSHQARGSRPRDLMNAVLFYLHEVLLPALGWRLSWHLRDALGVTGATALTGGFILVILAVILITQDRRCRVFVVTAVLTGIVFMTVTSAIAWNGPRLGMSFGVEHGARYSTVPILLLDAALIVAADGYARRWWPRPKAIAAVAALVAVLAAGWVTDFRDPVRRFSGGPGSAWALKADGWLSQCQHSPTGTITITFHSRYGVTTRVPCSSLRR
jgi:hypothetical protein